MNPGENKRRNKPAERVSLTTENVEFADKMLGQIHMSLPDLKLSRSDLINWILKSHGDKLNEKELASIERDYFDPVKALEAAIVVVKKQLVMGNAVDIQALLSEKMIVRRSRSMKRKAPLLSKVSNQEALESTLD